MNDERCDRDRVTALAELERKVARGGMEVDDFYEAHSALFQGGLWAISRLLEALDAIDKARALHFDNGDDDCVECGWAFPCGTVQELVINGGNESRDDR